MMVLMLAENRTGAVLGAVTHSTTRWVTSAVARAKSFISPATTENPRPASPGLPWLSPGLRTPFEHHF